jgi:hypothetical protein
LNTPIPGLVPAHVILAVARTAPLARPDYPALFERAI